MRRSWLYSNTLGTTNCTSLDRPNVGCNNKVSSSCPRSHRNGGRQRGVTCALSHLGSLEGLGQNNLVDLDEDGVTSVNLNALLPGAECW